MSTKKRTGPVSSTSKKIDTEPANQATPEGATAPEGYRAGKRTEAEIAEILEFQRASAAAANAAAREGAEAWVARRSTDAEILAAAAELAEAYEDSELSPFEVARFLRGAAAAERDFHAWLLARGQHLHDLSAPGIAYLTERLKEPAGFRSLAAPSLQEMLVWYAGERLGLPDVFLELAESLRGPKGRAGYGFKGYVAMQATLISYQDAQGRLKWLDREGKGKTAAAIASSLARGYEHKYPELLEKTRAYRTERFYSERYGREIAALVSERTMFKLGLPARAALIALGRDRAEALKTDGAKALLEIKSLQARLRQMRASYRASVSERPT